SKLFLDKIIISTGALSAQTLLESTIILLILSNSSSDLATINRQGCSLKQDGAYLAASKSPIISLSSIFSVLKALGDHLSFISFKISTLKSLFPIISTFQNILS